MEAFSYEKGRGGRHTNFFSGISAPFYLVTFRQDVTDCITSPDETACPFLLRMVWASPGRGTRWRLSGSRSAAARSSGFPDGIPAFTDLKEGAEQFHIVTLPFDEDPVSFCRTAARRAGSRRVLST